MWSWRNKLLTLAISRLLLFWLKSHVSQSPQYIHIYNFEAKKVPNGSQDPVQMPYDVEDPVWGSLEERNDPDRVKSPLEGETKERQLASHQLNFNPINIFKQL